MTHAKVTLCQGVVDTESTHAQHQRKHQLETGSKQAQNKLKTSWTSIQHWSPVINTGTRLATLSQPPSTWQRQYKHG